MCNFFTKVKHIFFTKKLSTLKLSALEHNENQTQKLTAPDFFEDYRGDIRNFLICSPQDIPSTMIWLEDFLHRALDGVRTENMEFLYRNRYNVAALSYTESLDWINFMAQMESVYIDNANLVLKHEINKVQATLLTQQNPVFYIKNDDETVH